MEGHRAMMRIVRGALATMAVAAMISLFVAAPAEAHMNSTGMGPAYDGLLHFLLSPEDVAPVLALALLAGLRGAEYGRRALLVLPGAWFVGGAIGAAAPVANAHPIVSACWFLVMGGLLAANAPLSMRAITMLMAALGLSHGYLNGAGLGLSIASGAVLLGLAFAVFVLVALASAFVVPLHAPWMRIAVRVAGSWIAASGLLMLGWASRS
jgi:hydrogenase/urease accessory protein HupE